MRVRFRRLIARLRRIDALHTDVVAGVVVLAGIELQLWVGSGEPGRAAAAPAALLLAAAVAGRRRQPVAAVVAAAVAVLGQELVGGRLTQDAVGALPALMLVFYAAGAFLDARWARISLGMGVAGVLAQVLIRPTSFADLFFTVVFLLVLPWTVGRMLRDRVARERSQRERAEQLDADREQLAWSAAHAERARIARELHDVIAHSVSVMVIQAGAARTVMGTDPTSAEAALDSVAGAGREALAEMRRLLDVLGQGAGRHALVPQPGLGDVDELIARARAAGLAMTLRVIGDSGPISPTLDLSAYRIIQEAVTNAIKHARRPARATVVVRWTADAIELEITDTGQRCGPAAGASGGHGIAGMHERAALHGGLLRAGPAVAGGFEVLARLPREVLA